MTGLGTLDDLPTPQVRRRRWTPRLVWLVPIVAAAVGLSLLVKSWREEGPQITVSFQTGEGIQVGKTLVKYRDVTVGRVSGVALSANHQQVLVTADLLRSAANLVTADTQFWIVKPRIGVGWVSGLDTLLSGSYIGMETGSSTGEKRTFTGLENPPPLSHGPAGLQVDLITKAVGSLATGAPVYFRHFQVGTVIDKSLSSTGTMRVSVFIDAPYDRFVKPVTRFWNASGVDLNVGTDGVNLHTESIATVLAGGVAFDDGPAEAGLESPSDKLTLYGNERDAMAPPDGEPHYVRLRFAHSLRGMDVGAPVEFVGVNIGSVAAVDLGYDPRDHSFPMIVTAKLYPRRMGQAYQSLAAQGATESDTTMAALVGALVGRGLRAQPRSANLLSGKLYVALDFIAASTPVHFDASLRPLELPTVSGTTQELESNLVTLLTKINKLPLQQVATQLNTDLRDLHGTLSGLNGQMLPRAEETLRTLNGTLESLNGTLDQGSPLQRNVADTLNDARGTLDAVKELADYLERNPDSLLRGRHSQRVERASPEPMSGGAP